MIINTYSVAQDSNLGNSLVYNLSAIDESWTYIKTLDVGGSSTYFDITDLDGYTKLLFLFGAKAIISFTDVNTMNAEELLSLGYADSSMAIVINRIAIPSNARYYTVMNNIITVYGK